MLVSEFHYDLPEELIAQEPLADRAASRLLRLARATGGIEDCLFRDFPEMLRADDLLVVNNSRVFPARLYGRRSGGKAQPVSARNRAAKDFLRGRIEILLTRQLREEPNEWECLVRPGRKIGIGEKIFFGPGDELQAQVIARGDFGERTLRFEMPVVRDVSEASKKIPTGVAENAAVNHPDFFSVVERIGHVPLPPYIAREDAAGDRERYQTVYARERGSVAAPTAGLHFTPEILDQIRQRGIEIADVTLHVGLGTFQPMHVERVEEHHLHAEVYSISDAAAEKINRARRESRRIVAVGTTTVRTLECSAIGGKVRPGRGEADLFIYPGYKFQIVGALLTNFHLPQSTLLMLVSALGGKDNVLRAYRHAVEHGYRFYSYGDCMFVE